MAGAKAGSQEGFLAVPYSRHFDVASYGVKLGRYDMLRHGSMPGSIVCQARGVQSVSICISFYVHDS